MNKNSLTLRQLYELVFSVTLGKFCIAMLQTVFFPENFVFLQTVQTQVAIYIIQTFSAGYKYNTMAQC